MGAAREKHLHYFAILKALDSDRCSCCQYSLGAVDKFYQSLMYENTNDRGIRSSFEAAHGFCPRHAYALLRRNDGLTIAIIYSSIFEAAVQRFDNPGRKGYNVHQHCPLCDREIAWERRFLEVLHAFLNDPDIRMRFERGSVLCIPHYRRLKSLVRELPEWFVHLHRERYGRYRRELRQYVNSCNFSHAERPELNSDDKIIWRNIVEVLYGYEGCSGA